MLYIKKFGKSSKPCSNQLFAKSFLTKHIILFINNALWYDCEEKGVDKKEPTSSSKTKKKEKKSKQSSKESTTSTLNIESGDCDSSNPAFEWSLRRSDRIKVIETTKQQNKELEIAEKLKRHNSSNRDNLLVDVTTVESSRSPPTIDEEPSSKRLASENELSAQICFSNETNTVSPGADHNVPEFKFPADYHCIDKNIYVGKRYKWNE